MIRIFVLYGVNQGKAEYKYVEAIVTDKSEIDPYKYKVVEKKGKITILQEIEVK